MLVFSFPYLVILHRSVSVCTQEAKDVNSILFILVLNRLTKRWDYITSLYENGALSEDTNNDAQEVLDDILNRTLTREYLDVLKVALVGGTAGTADNNEGGSMMDQDDHSMDALPHVTRAAQAAMQSDIISELGRKLLMAQVTCESIVCTIFK